MLCFILYHINNGTDINDREDFSSLRSSDIGEYFQQIQFMDEDWVKFEEVGLTC